MKNNTRKILVALLLVFVMMVGIFSVTSFAEESAPETKTYYFSNNKGWSQVYVHHWIDGGEGTAWPGEAATYLGQNEYGEGIYSIDVPTDRTHIIFNNGDNGQQTVDIMLSTVTDDGFYLDQNVDGKWTVGTYAFNISNIIPDDGTGDPGAGSGSTEANPDVEGLELAIGDYYLCGWLNGAAYGIEGDSANLGDNKFVDGKVTVTFNEQSYVVIKDANNNNYWTQSYITATTGTFYNVNTGAGEKMMVPAGRVEFTLYKGEGDTFVLTYESMGHTGGNEGNPEDAPDFDSYDKITVYLGNGQEWKNPMVYVWYRDQNGADYPYTTWEGSIELEIDENNYYYLEIPSICNYIIFRSADKQTADLLIPTGDTMLFDNVTNEWVKKDSYKPLPPHSDTEKNVTVAVKNDAGWEDVYCYYWSVTGVEPLVWPGLPMELGDDGYYYIEIPEGNGYVIFNNGNTAEGMTLQTADLKIPTDDNVLFNNEANSWAYLKIEANKPSGDVTPNPDNGNNNNNTPETPDTPKAELSFLQKLAYSLLLWLRSIEEFFKNMFVGNKA